MTENLAILLWKIIAVLILWPQTQKAEIPDRQTAHYKILNNPHHNSIKYYNSLNKVSLTQKGYIQVSFNPN